MEKAVLQNYPENNPKLCLELQLYLGFNEYRKYRVTAEYISFDYSDYLIEKLPTLPEQDRIGKALDQLRSLDSYTIHLATDDAILYITQNALLIKNTHLNGSEDVFDSYYIPKDDYIMQYIIKDGSIVDTYSCYVERSQLRPEFGFAKEVFLQETENQYIFHPKINSSGYLHDLGGFLPLIYDSYRFRTLDKLKLFTDKEDYFYVHDSEGLFLEYYNYNCTSIPQQYIDLVNSYNPTEN